MNPVHVIDLNKVDSNELPLSYRSPIDINIYWICDRDEEGRITSVFINETIKDKHIAYLDDMNQALEQKILLLKIGWVKMKKPGIQWKVTDDEIVRGERKPKKGQKSIKERLKDKHKRKYPDRYKDEK